MNEMIPVSYKNERPTVLGRDLHAALKVKTRYNDWFPRMCEYGFTEGIDFQTFFSKSTSGHTTVNHRLTIDMAKELCMIQRTDIGKRYRQYFIEVEKQQNSPDAIWARACRMADEKLRVLCGDSLSLSETIAVRDQQIPVWL